MIEIATETTAGHVAPGFEQVAEAFTAGLRRDDALGAAATIHWRGKVVVDLWGGWADAGRQTRWSEDTLVLLYSVSKGLSGLAAAVAVARGYFDYTDRVTTIWPEFGVAGKAAITVGQLLSEQAGLAAIDLKLTAKNMADQDVMADALARQSPNWNPGDYAGNHSYTLGWIICELIRRRDPAGRSLGRFLAEELAAPMGADVYMGLPETIDRRRIARIKGFGLLATIFEHKTMPWSMVAKLFWPWSLTFRALNNPLFLSGPAALDDDVWRTIELGAIGAIGNARSVAALYGAFATGCDRIGLTPAVRETLAKGFPPPRLGQRDAVLDVPINYSFGLEKPSPGWEFAPSASAYGTFAVGGSLAFADPEDQTAYAWVTNRLGLYARDDPRELMVRQAFYHCIGKS